MLVDEFLRPEVEPNIQYEPEQDVVAWRELDHGKVFLEIFKRPNGHFGFRYSAWVAWRDAGDFVRSHSWHRIDPKDYLITDMISEAIELADNNAEKLGLSFTKDWEQR